MFGSSPHHWAYRSGVATRFPRSHGEATMHALLRLTIAASAIGCLSITPTAAQKGYHVSRTPDELFAAFVRERQALDDKTNASVDLTHVLIYHDKYPSQTVEYLLRELEQFALTGTPQWL